MESELHLLDKQREDVILSDAKTRCLHCLMKNKELICILSAILANADYFEKGYNQPIKSADQLIRQALVNIQDQYSVSYWCFVVDKNHETEPKTE